MYPGDGSLKPSMIEPASQPLPNQSYKTSASYNELGKAKKPESAVGGNSTNHRSGPRGSVFASCAAASLRGP